MAIRDQVEALLKQVEEAREDILLLKEEADRVAEQARSVETRLWNAECELEDLLDEIGEGV